MNILLVFIGGGFGSLARYAVTNFVKSVISIPFPFGTLTVNVVGSFIMGVITSLIATKLTAVSEPVRLLTAVGFLGGFTTFSSFSIETLSLIENHEFIYALLNIVVNVTVGLLAAYFGVKSVL